MKILFFTTDFPPNLGGVAALSLEQAVHLARLGHVVRVETRRFGELPPVCQQTPNLEVHAHRIDTRPVARLLPLSKIASRAAREFAPDVFYASTHRGFGLPMALLARMGLRPYVFYVHGNEILTELHSPPRRFLLGQILKHAAGVVTNSDNTARTIVEENFAPLVPPLKVIHPAIDQNRLSDAEATFQAKKLRESWLASRNLPPHTVVILSLCRMSRQKGIDHTLRAISLLRAKKPDLGPFLYVLAGDGPDRARFEDLARDLNLQQFTFFAGRIAYHETASFLHAADVYIQPSQPLGSFIESFGISFLEAQFCGVPCIGTRFGGIPESVIDGETGILVPVGDDNALMDALETLIKDPQKRSQLGEAGRKHAAKFSWERHAQQLSEFLLECCERARHK